MLPPAGCQRHYLTNWLKTAHRKPQSGSNHRFLGKQTLTREFVAEKFFPFFKARKSPMRSALYWRYTLRSTQVKTRFINAWEWQEMSPSKTSLGRRCDDCPFSSTQSSWFPSRPRQALSPKGWVTSAPKRTAYQLPHLKPRSLGFRSIGEHKSRNFSEIFRVSRWFSTLYMQQGMKIQLRERLWCE